MSRSALRAVHPITNYTMIPFSSPLRRHGIPLLALALALSAGALLAANWLALVLLAGGCAGAGLTAIVIRDYTRRPTLRPRRRETFSRALTTWHG